MTERLNEDIDLIKQKFVELKLVAEGAQNSSLSCRISGLECDFHCFVKDYFPETHDPPTSDT